MEVNECFTSSVFRTLSRLRLDGARVTLQRGITSSNYLAISRLVLIRCGSTHARNRIL